MSKQKYAYMKALLPEIKVMLDEGKSHREIEEYFGLTGDRPVHNLLKRERRKEQRQRSGLPTNPKGRPRVRPLTSTEQYEKEISRLKMENELLRDFLQLTGRK